MIHLDDPSPEQLHRQRAHYFANVSMIDAQVGAIVEALRQRGVLDDTIIIFTSDHGDCLNDHGHIQKWTMYEPSVRVPAIVWQPGAVRHQVIDGLTSLFDFGPTILEAAGVTPPAFMEAESLMPILIGETGTARERVFAEHTEDMILEETQFMTMVREGDYKLVHFIDSDEGQLFDLAADPGERVNLWDSAGHAATRARLERAILEWQVESTKRTQGFKRALAGV